MMMLMMVVMMILLCSFVFLFLWLGIERKCIGWILDGVYVCVSSCIDVLVCERIIGKVTRCLVRFEPYVQLLCIRCLRCIKQLLCIRHLQYISSSSSSRRQLVWYVVVLQHTDHHHYKMNSCGSTNNKQHV